MTRKKELRLRSTDINILSDDELIRFIFGRDSLFRDYKLLHGLETDEVFIRAHSVIFHNEIRDLCQEFRICFAAALQAASRQTYYFNIYVIDLIERFYSDFIFNNKKKETRLDQLPSEDDPTLVSYDWVLQAKILTPYQRYLLFEYLALGYSIETLAKRRYCTTRTIDNHLKQMLDQFGY